MWIEMKSDDVKINTIKYSIPLKELNTLFILGVAGDWVINTNRMAWDFLSEYFSFSIYEQ